MNDNDKPQTRKDKDRSGRRHRRNNAELDEALEETFPASDPPAPTQPARHEE